MFQQEHTIHHQLPPQPAIYAHDVNYVNFQPTQISTPQYWTEAIYQLNNAILETSSVGGGAENAQFLYILETGDIILELDGIKVSGFTLVDFTTLLECKPVHLLKAVQTRQSQGLTIYLKQFLNCTFHENSTEKELQDLIRDNLYRRTVPCTTRPPRPGEVDKVDYHFLSKEQFIELDHKGILLESGMYGGHYYGTILPPIKFADISNMSKVNQYENFFDELSMMQMQQQKQNQPEYHSVSIDLPVPPPSVPPPNTLTVYQAEPSYTNYVPPNHDYKYHQVILNREHRDMNWGIKLIGGLEVERAISIVSIIPGGAASKSGGLQPMDEIIFINGNNVTEATHLDGVRLLKECANQVVLIVRRKHYDNSCEVKLIRNMDEGFGFVIKSRDNCAQVGRIIEGSPADRCGQLCVKDRIVAVNGQYITPNMTHPEIVNMIKQCGSELSLRIIPENSYNVELCKSPESDNFGFTMRGGSDTGVPLFILRVAPDGLARNLLNVGDQILEINNLSTVGMTHDQAATIIKHSYPTMKLKLRRNNSTPSDLFVYTPKDLQKFNHITSEMKSVLNCSTPSSFHQEGSISSEGHPLVGAQPQTSSASLGFIEQIIN